MIILIYLLMAISLSMDAFSLAIIYGTNRIEKKKSIILSIIVGIFHFLMPLLGSILGKHYLIHYIHNANFVVGIVFLVIAVQMIRSAKKEETDVSCITLNKLSYFLFPLTVSLDSFSIGIALGLNNENVLLASSLFSLISGLFTFVGLSVGKKLNETFGKKACFIGGIILILLALDYIF